MIEVSVVIPAYNVEEFIEECLDSVYAQTYPILEVIVVDNNSTDRTLENLKKIKEEKHNDLIILKEENPGANYARNLGLKNAKGEWIQFLDADDLILKDKINQQILLIENSSKTNGFIAGSSKTLSSNGEELFTRIPKGNDENILNIISGFSGNTCANLWRKSCVLNVGAWNQSLKSSQETDLMLRIILGNYDYLIDNQINTIIRERKSGQISKSNPARKWKNYIDVRIDFLEELKNKNVDEWNKNKLKFQSYMVSSFLILSIFYKNTYRDYRSFISEINELSPVAGLNKKWIRLINVLGYRVVFKIKFFTNKKSNL